MSVSSTPVPDRPLSAAGSRRARLGTPAEPSEAVAAAAAGLDEGRAVLPLAVAPADAGSALAQAEDRLASQRNRAPSVAERYGELIVEILRAQQPDTSDHALDVAQLAALVAARMGIDPLDRGLVRRTAELHDV